MILTNLDRYLLRRAVTPMSAVLISTMVAFLMERLMRSLELLSQTAGGFDLLMRLLTTLLPHYVGLTLPGGFFIGLFVVVHGLNKSSEIDAILASGVSLGRFAAPLVGLGLALMLLSVALFGFLQPYSRYAYHAVLHAAANAGWDGAVRPAAIVSAGPDLVLTADDADSSGHRLKRVFIRTVGPDGREDVIAAASAEVVRAPGARVVTLVLDRGQLVSTTREGRAYVTDFTTFRVRLPTAHAAALLRGRGQEISELTLVELARQGFAAPEPALSRQVALAELFTRTSRALVLPLLPLLAVPLGLSAKRGGAGAAMAIGGLMLFGFETSMVLAQAVVRATSVPAAAAIGAPAGLFGGACVATWIASRRRPGENPVSWLSEQVAAVFAAVGRMLRRPQALPD
ncbi:LptF/LptG family permease [Phenylobacterium sp.]|uniref:LptF/LptG family permease n=1 Tax=Phenylobacterium sp. TaxID=1871053 RepID=UPI0035B3B2FB